jgi:hypothetical protein
VQPESWVTAPTHLALADPSDLKRGRIHSSYERTSAFARQLVDRRGQSPAGGLSGFTRTLRVRAMIVSAGLGCTTVPVNVTSESIFARNFGPTPVTRLNPSRVTNGPRIIRSMTIRFAIAGLTPGSESICERVATSRSSFPLK